MQDCDFDLDGFGGQWKQFLKWNGARYETIEDAADSAPVYRHARFVNPVTTFQSGIKLPDEVKARFATGVNDLRLSPKSEAVDAGVVLPNVNDGYQGQAPDLGAYESNRPLPHYGPRPLRTGT